MSDLFPYIETDSYSIVEHKDYLRISWQSKVVSEQIKAGLNELQNLMQGSGKKRFFSDVRLCESSWTSSNDWIVQQWLPQVLHLGLQKVAFLIADNLVQKVSVENLRSKLQRKQRFINRFFRVFSQEAEALSWLER